MSRALSSLGLAIVLLGACNSSTETYTYVRVKVDLDLTSVPDEDRKDINACGVAVEGRGGAHSDTFSLQNCVRGKTPYDLGTFEYATLSNTGTLTFTLRAINIGRKDLAVGVSDTVAIVPGQTIDTSILAKSTASPADGGAGD